MSNARSFEELCLGNYKELVGFAFKLTRNQTAAEDIVHDSVVRALKAWDRWEPQGDNEEIQARAWMFQIIRNTFASYYQGVKRTTTALKASEDLALVAFNADTVHTSGSQYCVPVPAASDEISEDLQDALDRIKPDWAAVIKLTLIDGLTQEKAAEHLGISFGTVRSRTARALAALARILGPSAKQRWGHELPKHLTRTGARKNAATFEESLSKQADANCVNGIVAHDDSAEFVGA